MARQSKLEVKDVLDLVTAPDSEIEGLDDDSDGESDGWGDQEDGSESSEDDNVNQHHDDSSSSSNESDNENIPLEQLHSKKSKTSKKKPTYQFTTDKFVSNPIEFVGDDPVSPDPNVDRSPYEYLKLFIQDDMLEKLACETNRYSLEKYGTIENFVKSDMDVFLGCYFMMGIVKLPKVSDYWRAGLRFPLIADAISRNRFQRL
ncbi:hypothetical protein SNE40_016235 [Patella caerulea]